eukprot:3005546-Rhodomonas_salina.3
MRRPVLTYANGGTGVEEEEEGLPQRYTVRPTRLLCGAHTAWRKVLAAYVLAMRCPVLTWRAVLSAYVLAVRCAVLTQGTTCLCAGYVVSGTDTAYGAISMCACDAVSSTKIAFGATRHLTSQTSR